jgi:hypothetical protein
MKHVELDICHGLYFIVCISLCYLYFVVFYRVNFLIRGNKRPTRCNRLVFYCKTYCLLNMFRAPLCPSSGALELYGWLLPMVLGSMVYRSLVWCGDVDYVSGLLDTARLVDNKFCNKKPICCIYLAFYFHVLTTMHGQTHIR